MATASAAFTPPCMNWEAQDLPDEFARFKQYCNLVFQGPYNEKPDEAKASFILLWIGRPGIDIYNSWNICSWNEPGDKDKPNGERTKHGPPVHGLPKWITQMDYPWKSFERRLFEARHIIVLTIPYAFALETFHTCDPLVSLHTLGAILKWQHPLTGSRHGQKLDPRPPTLKTCRGEMQFLSAKSCCILENINPSWRLVIQFIRVKW